MRRSTAERGTYLLQADLVDAPRESKVGDHEDAVVVEEQVGSLHVAVEDAVLEVEAYMRSRSFLNVKESDAPGGGTRYRGAAASSTA